MNYIQSIKDDLAEDREALEGRELCTALLPDNLPHVNRAYTTGDYVAICIPASLAMLRALRKELGHSWSRKSKIQHSDGDVSISYIHKDYPSAKLLVWLITTIEGATCYRVLVEEKIAPVYRMVCN